MPSKNSAYACPVCGRPTLKVVRTLTAGATRRVRFYLCTVPGCGGYGTSEENFRPAFNKTADVPQKRGQPVRAA